MKKGCLHIAKMNYDQYQIGSDDSVAIPSLEIDITKGCNLQCPQCGHFSPYRKGIVPSKEVLEWIEAWSKKVQPSVIRVLGGEPLLHPELGEILRATRNGWPEIKIILATNGTLLKDMEDELFATIRSADVFVSISQKQNDPEFNKSFRTSIYRIDVMDVRYCVFAAYEHWRMHYLLTSAGVPRPFFSNPAKAFENCLGKHYHSIFDNRLHRCSFLKNAYEAYREKSLSGEWKIVDDIPTMSTDCSAEDIVRFLCSGPFEACMICPERNEKINEIPLDFSTDKKRSQHEKEVRGGTSYFDKKIKE